MRALIVDDDQIALSLIRNIVEEAGYEVETARNGREALQLLRSRSIRLLITDWEMPEMNGIELCRTIRNEDFSGYVYVIMLTAKDTPQQKIDGIFAGADNFIAKPVNAAELLVCLKTADRILSIETRDVAIFALAKLAESRDSDTGCHIERVQSYSRLLAQQLSTFEKYKNVIDRDYVRLIYQTSPLHDIGKVGIPDPVLLKPGKLDPHEFAIMRTHAQLGARTLDAALQRFPGAKFLVMARDIAASHHEKYDGSGYPIGLVGEQIPLCGRIVALADVYDALTSDRVYKKAIPHQQARELIVSESGSHFDPDVVESFLQIEDHFISIKERLADSESAASAPASIPDPHDKFTERDNGPMKISDPVSGINQRMEQLAITDDLTGLFNRRHAIARLEEQWALADRYGHPLTIGLIDIDHFRIVNTTHGKAIGDLVLREVGDIIKETVRTTDTVCRFGGDVFLIIFPGQTLQEATTAAERLRSSIAMREFVGNQNIRIAISVGIAPKLHEMTEFSELLNEADKSLRAAKQSGRSIEGRREENTATQRRVKTG